jgi:hypothetical protein
MTPPVMMLEQAIIWANVCAMCETSSMWSGRFKSK